jgi:hypothetical protein
VPVLVLGAAGGGNIDEMRHKNKGAGLACTLTREDAFGLFLLKA